jgi:hypothetical protein
MEAQLVAEIVIWLAEAVVLYLILRKSLSFLEVLGLSLVMNAASIAIGLVLPVCSRQIRCRQMELMLCTKC